MKYAFNIDNNSNNMATTKIQTEIKLIIPVAYTRKSWTSASPYDSFKYKRIPFNILFDDYEFIRLARVYLGISVISLDFLTSRL